MNNFFLLSQNQSGGGDAGMGVRPGLVGWPWAAFWAFGACVSNLGGELEMTNAPS